MVSGISIKIFTGKEIVTKKYVVGQITEVTMDDGFVVKARVESIDISGGMENRLRIRFEGGRGISFNLTAANVMAWRTQVDGYWDNQRSGIRCDGVEWPDMAL